jgi:hypothetical protein
MAIRKQDYVIEKLKNFINFIRLEDTFNMKSDNEYLKQLNSCVNDKNALQKYLIELSRYADAECNVDDSVLKLGLNMAKIDWDKVKEENKLKFKRYIKCFVKAARV